MSRNVKRAADREDRRPLNVLRMFARRRHRHFRPAYVTVSRIPCTIYLNLTF